MDGELLIKEVFSRPPIWQSKHKLHHNRGVVNKMWDDVAKAMDSPKDYVKIKWKNLRDTYRKELKKVTTSTSGDAGGQLKTSNWQFFELLYFLRDEMNPSQTLSNLGLHEVVLQNLEIVSDVTNPEGNEEVEDDELSCSMTTPTPRPASASSSSVEPTNRKRKESVQDQVAKKMLMLEEQKIELLKNGKQEETEDYHFLMSLLPHFSDMAPMQKLTVRNQLTQVIIDAKTPSAARRQTFNCKSPSKKPPARQFGSPSLRTKTITTEENR